MHTKNALDAVRTTIHERQIRPVWPIQAHQSDELMWQFREKIAQHLTILRRKQIDPHARNQLKLERTNHNKYPIGYCGWIRNCVSEIIEDTIGEICRGMDVSGIKFRDIWVIQDEKYMQNAIQAWAWIIDAANDTCDTRKPPVVIERIENSGMRNPRNHADLCSVLESYWWVRCYPNIYYPILSPFFPVIFSMNSRVGFISSVTDWLDAYGVFNGFSSAEDFIFHSQFSERRLSEQEQSYLTDISDHDLCPASQHSLQDVRKTFRRAKSYGPGKLAEIYTYFLLQVQESPNDVKLT